MSSMTEEIEEVMAQAVEMLTPIMRTAAASMKVTRESGILREAALTYKKFFDELIDAGFTQDQAIEIAARYTATGK